MRDIMEFIIKEWPDKSATLMTEHGPGCVKTPSFEQTTKIFPTPPLNSNEYVLQNGRRQSIFGYMNSEFPT
jgi:hypothetical protein